MGIRDEKSSLRTRYRHERHERFIEHSFEYLANSPEISEASVIASYMSYADEPRTDELNTALVAAGKTLSLRRVDASLGEWDGSDAAGPADRQVGTSSASMMRAGNS